MNIKLLNPENRYDDYVQQILANRGVEDIENFLTHSWDDVQTPYALDNIKAAAYLVLRHMHEEEEGEKVAILTDPDVDGYASSALLYNYFKMQQKYGDFGTLPEIEFIFHDGKQHGLGDTEVMRKIRDQIKPNLLIIPDASGTNEQYKALNELGIDIVVLDHHETADKGDGIHTIVVNNQQSYGYKNKALSGVGVVYQFCRVLDEMLLLAVADQYLDLVSLGMAADVMDFRSKETRFLIQEGLQNINLAFLKTMRKFMCYQMTRQYDEDKVKFTYTSISWNIAPLINAVTRIGTEKEKKIVFRSFLEDQAELEVESGKRGEKGVMVPLVKEALRMAVNAKSRQARRQDKLVAAIDEVIREDGMLDDKVIIVPIDDFDKEQRALSGLIANKFIDWYKRPCILLFKDEERNIYSGSLRSPENIDAFKNFKDQCEKSHLTTFASGHQQAAGIGVKEENIPLLRNYFNEKYSDVDTQPTIWVDFILDVEDDLLDLAETLDSMSDSWGQGIKAPIIAIKNVPVGPTKLSLFKAETNPTLSIKLPNGNSCIKFRSSKEEFSSLLLPPNDVEQQYRITVVGELEINEYNNNRSAQVKIKDYQLEKAEYVF